MEVPVEWQSRELTLHMQAEPAGSMVAGEGGGSVQLPCQQGAHQVAQPVQEGGHGDGQPLVQLLGKGKVRGTAMPRGPQHWEKAAETAAQKKPNYFCVSQHCKKLSQGLGFQPHDRAFPRVLPGWMSQEGSPALSAHRGSRWWAGCNGLH